MNHLLKKQIILTTFTLSFISSIFTSCDNAGKAAAAIQAPTAAAPIAGTAEQQQRYQEVFQAQYSRDSVWVLAFENAFSNAFGPDSLKNFLNRETLPHVAFGQNHEIKGTERGEFVINNGVTLTIYGVVYGRIAIMKGGFLRNNGAIYGNIENIGGTFEDNGVHQGALIVR